MKIILFTLLVTFTTQTFAWGLKELGEESATPFTTDAKYVLWTGAAITATLVIFEDAVIDPFQQKQARNRTLGDSSRWGDWMGQLVPNALYVGGMSIAGANGDPEGYRRAMGMFKASAYSTAVTTILKYTVREPRPIDHHWKNSFPSGHSTTAFAFSGYVAAEHGWAWGGPALALSTFIGYSRINDNMHWLHDVTAGATIGWVYGWGISRYQKKQREAQKDSPAKADEPSTSFIPIYDSRTVGLALYREF